MTGNARAPVRMKFPVSARESPKLKIESYFLVLVTAAHEAVHNIQKKK